MPETITDDRATEIAAMNVTDLTNALVGLDLSSCEKVLHAEEARGDGVRSTAIGAIVAKIDALADSDQQPPAATCYVPPADTTGITFSTGRELRADSNGFVSVPDDLSDDEFRQLINAGFQPI